MITYILIALVILIIGLLAYASTKPNSVRYERSAVINAPAEKILPHIADFHKWLAWSPYERLDPNMKRGFSGADSGKGAKYNWEGNNKVGMGTMEVIEVAPTVVKVDLRFIRPFKNDCLATFTFVPQGSATNVTWTMEGPNLFMGKVMSVFLNMDGMIGKAFAEGLGNLKGVVEKG
ncbi:MAG: SRPBCC family protein [Flavobacteriales bacterium]